MSIEMQVEVSAECAICGRLVEIYSDYDDIAYLNTEETDLRDGIEKTGEVVQYERDEYWVCDSCKDTKLDEIDANKEEIDLEIAAARETLEQLEKRLEDWNHYSKPKRRQILLEEIGVIPKSQDEQEKAS